MDESQHNFKVIDSQKKQMVFCALVNSQQPGKMKQGFIMEINSIIRMRVQRLYSVTK
jgi:hypothetical protein